MTGQMSNHPCLCPQELGICPSYYGCGLRLLSLENRRKIEPKEIPSFLIPHLATCYIYTVTYLSDNSDV